MKKLLAWILMAIMCVSLCACGETDNYESDKKAIMTKMIELNDSSVALGGEYLRVGAVTGEQDLLRYIKIVTSIEDMQGYLDYIANVDDRKELEEYTDALFSTSLRAAQRQNRDAVNKQERKAIEKFKEYAEVYNKLYDNVYDPYSVLQSDIKDFKAKYEDKHRGSVELVVEYYLICSDLAELVLEPSGTLLELSDDIETFQKDFELLERKIELN